MEQKVSENSFRKFLSTSRGVLTIRPKIPKFSKRGQMVRNFLGKVPENPEIVEFPESKPFNRDKDQMERKFPGENVRKFGYTSRGCPRVRNLCKFVIFYSALASCFGRGHSELDISRKDDCDAYSIMETLTNLSYTSINTSYS